MGIRIHGNPIAITLGGLAVVIAATGTAVAATTTHVSIADASTAANVARVDSTGRLATSGPTSTINIPMTLSPNTNVPVSSPTKATLGITDMLVGNPTPNASYTGSDYLIGLYATDAPATGPSCSPSGDTRLLVEYPVSPGDTLNQAFAAPIIVKPASGKRYCLTVRVDSYGTPNGWYQTILNIDAYVANGTYSGIGLNGATAGAATGKRAAQPHR